MHENVNNESFLMKLVAIILVLSNKFFLFIKFPLSVSFHNIFLFKSAKSVASVVSADCLT